MSIPALRLSRSPLLAALLMLAATAIHAQEMLSGPALAKELQRGGYVLIFRHGATDWSTRDESRSQLENCATQRNLSEAGRLEMKRMGDTIRALRVPVGAVMASPYCRTRETAELAFGRTELSRDLLWPGSSASAAAMSEHRAKLDAHLGTAPGAGKNTVLVTHGFVIQGATQLNVAEGEVVVVRPGGGSKFTVVGRIVPSAWSDLQGAR